MLEKKNGKLVLTDEPQVELDGTTADGESVNYKSPAVCTVGRIKRGVSFLTVSYDGDTVLSFYGRPSLCGALAATFTGCKVPVLVV